MILIETEIENKNVIISNGFIVQLFSIFKDNSNFCLKERRIETCEICNSIKELNETFYSHLILVDQSKIYFNNIESIILYSFIFEGLINVIIVNLMKICLLVELIIK